MIDFNINIMRNKINKAVFAKLTNNQNYSDYSTFMQGKVWLIGLLFTFMKLCYNLAYLIIKYSKINPEQRDIVDFLGTLDNIYVGLMIANLCVLLCVSILARCKPFFSTFLPWWTVIGLFFESFQWYVFVKQVPPYDCAEHQLRITSFVPLTYVTAAAL